MSSWNDPELLKLFRQQIPLIDVRAPIEFHDGSIPFSVNLPILNNEERAQVGTCYKELGQAAAIELGNKLVTGTVKSERVKAWSEFIHQHPEAEVFCFRGGLRSKTACQWLSEVGLSKGPIEGGYKRIRTFFLSWLNEAPLPDLIKIGGPTGSAKSDFILKFVHLDLEKLAHHRGSAFGFMGAQPTQITFENQLALELIKFSGKKIIVEDESATIGKIVVPMRLFAHMRESSMVILKVEQEQRIKNIFNLNNTFSIFFIINYKTKAAIFCLISKFIIY